MNIIFSTVFCGVAVYIIGEILLKFVLEPLQEYKKVIGKIDNKLKYYANVITNSGLPKDMVDEAVKVLRDISCELEATYKQISFKHFFNKIYVIPKEKQVSDASKSLIYLANSSGMIGKEVENSEEIEKVREKLNIPKI